MRVAYLTHSLVSCWNHGNAHFQRGLLTALRRLGHDAIALEPENSWSRENLLAEAPDAEPRFRAQWPDLIYRRYAGVEALRAELHHADLVVVHEWNDPEIVEEVGRLRRLLGFTLLFHDTHHRAISDPPSIRRFDLAAYDAVLAFGAALAERYQAWGWKDRVFVWHEAADTAHFWPIQPSQPRHGAVWIGNWGDGERGADLEEMLLRPAAETKTALDVYGVRYPDEALAALCRYGARYRGWLANAAVPDVFAQHEFTVHVPRRYYADKLPGIPTIRVFEALACGIPLICAPWQDCEGLFRPGEDYLIAHSGAQMANHMRTLRSDTALATALAQSGLARIRSRHTCDHRARELLAIAVRLGTTIKAVA